MDLHDEYMEKSFVIDHKQLQFDKNYGWTLFVICDKPDGTFSGHETFFIHDDLFDRIKSTHQEKNIMRKIISNELNENESPIEGTELCDDNIQNKKRTIIKKSPKHTLYIKRQNISSDYRDK